MQMEHPGKNRDQNLVRKEGNITRMEALDRNQVPSQEAKGKVS